jgi:PAS domain S-box-containing protein
VALVVLLVFLGCYLGARTGTAVVFPGVGTAILFPPYAVLAAALILAPMRHWWMLLLAAAAGDFWPHLQHERMTSFVLTTEAANLVRALVAALGVRWLDHRPGFFDTLRGMVVFVVFGVVLAPAVGAFLGAWVVVAHHPPADYWTAWSAWLLSNMLTAVTLLPLILVICTSAKTWIKGLSPARTIEANLLALAVVSIGAYGFTRSEETGIVPASLYAPLPILVWAAVRFGPGGMIASLSALVALTIAGAVNGRGPFVTQDPAGNLMQLQIFFIALCVPLLLLSSIVEEQARTAAALRQSQADYRTVVEDQTELICRFLPDGTYTFVNGAYCRYFNRRPAELLGRTFWEFVPPEAQQAARQHIASVTAERPLATIEHEVIAPGGEIRWQQWTNRGFFDKRGHIVDYQAVGRDVTERRRSEDEHRQLEMQKLVAAALRESEARFRQLADAMPQIVWAARPDGSVDYCNRKWYALTSAPEGATGWRNWLAVVHPEDRRPCARLWFKSVRGDLPFQVEMRLKRRSADVSEYRWYLSRALPVRDNQGTIVRWYGTCTDVHDHKLAEQALRDSEARLSEANRAKDRFLAALSHELRTPLTPVMLAAEAHLHDHSLPDELCRDLNTIYANTALEVALIDDLLDLTRVGRGKIELHRVQLDAHSLLEHAARTSSDEIFIRKSLRISLELGASRHWVMGDPTRLSQVFWNIIKNAVKFSEPGSAITVRTTDDGDGEGQPLAIEFIDTGYGIEPAQMSLIFDAFEQGDREITSRFGGMGLGLALCKAFVEMHDGRISAFSRGRGMGATFRVELPTIEPSISPPSPVSLLREAKAPLPSRVEATAPSGMRILLVEDHEFTAALLARLLRSCGHEVMEAGNVSTALELAERCPIDLVISDIQLPDGTGLEMMSHLSRAHGLRGIAVSGYGMQEDLLQSRRAGFIEHLVKPVTFESVQAAISRAVAHPVST